MQTRKPATWNAFPASGTSSASSRGNNDVTRDSDENLIFDDVRAAVDSARRIASTKMVKISGPRADIIGQDEVIWVRSSRAALLSVRLKTAARNHREQSF